MIETIIIHRKVSRIRRADKLVHEVKGQFPDADAVEVIHTHQAGVLEHELIGTTHSIIGFTNPEFTDDRFFPHQ
jgi:hypothetical protein